MANDTVTTAQLTSEQIDTVNRAALEVQLVARALQTYIESEDTHGTIYPVSKTMLERINALADAQGWALEPEKWTDGDDDGLKRAESFIAAA